MAAFLILAYFVKLHMALLHSNHIVSFLKIPIAVADDHRIAVGICAVVKMQQLDTSFFFGSIESAFLRTLSLRNTQAGKTTYGLFKGIVFLGALKLDPGGVNP